LDSAKGTKSLDAAIFKAIKIRAFEVGLLELFGLGKIRGTVHTCWGQEMTPSLLSAMLNSKDHVFGTHRGHGYFLSITEDFNGLAREILGKVGGVSKGMGGSQHLYADGIITNGIQGGLVPVAAGYASIKDGRVGVAVVGEGTLGQGVFYETLNIANLFEIPLLLVIEDNEISQTTPSIQNFYGSIESRIRGFDTEYFFSKDSTSLDFEETIASALAYVRNSNKPAVLHIKTQRLGPHSKGDDNRSLKMIEEISKSDPLNWVISTSLEFGDFWESSKSEIRELLEEILAAQPAEDSIPNQLNQIALNSSTFANDSTASSNLPIRKQITKSIGNALSNSDTWFMGEDIEQLPIEMEKNYPGAFGISDNLSSLFPNQVHNFPISEQAMVGFAIGRAFAGKPTIVEIMFGDFTTLIVDQIRQQASKMVSVYGADIGLPLLIRTPMGGRRGYGPTHSQNFEGLFFGIPNIVVFMVSPFGVADSTVSNLLSLKLPVLFIENKDLYAEIALTDAPIPYKITRPASSGSPFAVAVPGRTPQATVVTYGNSSKILIDVLNELALKHEILIDLFVFEIISPLRINEVSGSLKRTNKLVLVEESLSEMGLMSSLVSALTKFEHESEFSVLSIGGIGDIGSSLASETDALISQVGIVRKLIKFIVGEK
jgi:2-oxoisovalerate dehydrogenase E1 component